MRVISIRCAVQLLREDGWGLIRAVAVVAAVRLVLWWLPFRTVYVHLQNRKRNFTRRPDSYLENVPVQRVIRRVQRASRVVPGATCLVQGLAAEKLLAQAGHIAVLRIGVARADAAGEKQLSAHAWIEYNGEVVLGGAGYNRFTPLPPLEKGGGNY